jgi:hypothetical protein
MTKEKQHKTKGGKFLLSDYVVQSMFLVVLSAAVALIYLKYPIFWKDHWIPITINASGIGILALISFWRDFWRNYRWILAPFVLIVVLFIDTSWIKSNLSMNALEKPHHDKYRIPSSTIYLNVETPAKILYESISPITITLWIKCDSPCTPQKTSIFSNNPPMLFAVQTQADIPLQWRENLEVILPEDGSAVTVFFQPPSFPDETQKIELSVNVSSQTISLDKNKILLEDRKTAQRNAWINTLLDTGSIVLSLIGVVFAGIKQLEEEQKRKRIDEIKQAIERFDNKVQSDFSKALDDLLRLTQDWRIWEKTLQTQFSEKLASFLESGLFWEIETGRVISEFENDVEQILKLCDIASYDNIQLKLLDRVSNQDERALLELVKEFPQSFAVVKRITKNLPKEIKDKISKDFRKDFASEITLLSGELDFPTGYPLLQILFQHYGEENIELEDSPLTKWLRNHKLNYSPFLDAENPFIYLPKSEYVFFVDQISPGYTFDTLSKNHYNFKFRTVWDLRAAVYNYCKDLPGSIAPTSFLILFSPSLFIKFSGSTTHEFILHSLAEQWLWTLAKTPALFYDLNDSLQKMLGRLLFWHCGSSSAVIFWLKEYTGEEHKQAASITDKSTQEKIFENFFRKTISWFRKLIGSKENTKEIKKERGQDNSKEKNTQDFLKKAHAWLKEIDTLPLRVEEMNTLVELRPASMKRSIILVPSINLNSQTNSRIFREKHEILDKVSDWLDIHHYTLVHFQLSDTDWWRLTDKVLTQKVNERVQQCVAKENVSLDQQVVSFDDLFVRHNEEAAERILARKANGSPGEMVRLGQKLLLQHAAKYPSEEDLHIEDLINLE